LKLPFSRARVSISALTAALALAVVGGTAPAQAHDALASTSPADGTTITTNPGKVSITLTNAPDTRIPGSNVIKVTAPDGHVVSKGDVTVEGATLTVAAEVDHDGKHTVDWRAVSADGHPIEGTFSFTYTPAGGDTHSPAATESSPAATGSTTQAATPAPATESPAPASAQPAQDNTGLFFGIGAVLLILVAVGAYLIGRRIKAGTGASE
jgi:methionine-rich copper-binding protein CopC